jgi:hypothetical protein
MAAPEQGSQVVPAAASECRSLTAGRDARHGSGDEGDGPVEIGFVAAGRVPRAERRPEPGLKDALSLRVLDLPGLGGLSHGVFCCLDRLV